MPSSTFVPPRAARAGRLFASALALTLVAGCGEQALPTALAPHAKRASTIADASRGFKRGFYWLAPMVKTPTYAGTFDAAVEPMVHICELTGGGCGAAIAAYTLTSGPDGETVRLSTEDEHYHVNWHTNEFDLSTTALYRVSVHVGPNELMIGYADVQPVNNGSGLKNVDTDEVIGLVDGRTLPIKFRIETGVIAMLRVEPEEADAEPGATQQFVAIVTDIHGNVIPADVTWSSSDENVATVDQNGLATAVADGEASIDASIDGLVASGLLRVETGVIVVPTIASGQSHACTLTDDGRAFCWGQNHQGQLGDGTLINRHSPVHVGGDLRFKAIAPGPLHTCALTLEGKAWCWGINQDGNLGDGTSVRRLTPVEVVGGHTFVSISAGSSNTCALKDDGSAWCWGQGAFGAVGNGSFANVDVVAPTAVLGGHTFASVSVGQQFVCGVTIGNQGFCWGAGNSGRLGNGSNTNRSTPTPIQGGHAFASIDAGEGHSCAVTVAGEGFCWGSSQFGRLGNGVGSLGTFPTPQLVLGGVTWASISAGGPHSCGVSLTGAGFCWGGNVGGSLGTGSGLSRTTPGLVAGGLTWASISASGQFIFPGGGDLFAFSCGITVDAVRYCWGSNQMGQLGNGSGTSRVSPFPVASLPEP